MRRILLLAAALFVLPACEDLLNDPDDNGLVGTSFTLVKANDQTLPLETIIGVCDVTDQAVVNEYFRIEGGTLVVTSDTLLKVELAVQYRCGSEGTWEPVTEAASELKYERNGSSLTLFEKYDDSSPWEEVGVATLTTDGLVAVVQVGESETDVLKLEFEKVQPRS